MAIRLKLPPSVNPSQDLLSHWCPAVKSQVTVTLHLLALCFAELLTQHTNSWPLWLFSKEYHPCLQKKAASLPQEESPCTELCSPKHRHDWRHHKTPDQSCHLQPKQQLIATHIFQHDPASTEWMEGHWVRSSRDPNYHRSQVCHKPQSGRALTTIKEKVALSLQEFTWGGKGTHPKRQESSPAYHWPSAAP